jgi:hypothetical protein
MNILDFRAVKKQSVTEPRVILQDVGLREKVECTKETTKKSTMWIVTLDAILLPTLEWCLGEQTEQRKKTLAAEAVDATGVHGAYEQLSL